MSSEAPQRIEVVPFPIGTWSPELRQELIELEQISQKVSNKAEKMIFRKDGGPKITYSILTGDFLTRPELYKNSWVYVARHPETARIIAVVVASIKECLVKGKPVNVAFTYLGRISPDSRSGGLAGFVFIEMVKHLYSIGITYMTCYVLEENVQAIKIFRKSGMIKEASRIVFLYNLDQHRPNSVITASVSKLEVDQTLKILNRIYGESDGLQLAQLAVEFLPMRQHKGSFFSSVSHQDGSKSEAFAMLYEPDYARIKTSAGLKPYTLVHSVHHAGQYGGELLQDLLDQLAEQINTKGGGGYLMIEISSAQEHLISKLEKRSGALGSCVEQFMTCTIGNMLKRKSNTPIIDTQESIFFDPRDFSTLMFFTPSRDIEINHTRDDLLPSTIANL